MTIIGLESLRGLCVLKFVSPAHFSWVKQESEASCGPNPRHPPTLSMGNDSRAAASPGPFCGNSDPGMLCKIWQAGAESARAGGSLADCLSHSENRPRGSGTSGKHWEQTLAAEPASSSAPLGRGMLAVLGVLFSGLSWDPGGQQGASRAKWSVGGVGSVSLWAVSQWQFDCLAWIQGRSVPHCVWGGSSLLLLRGRRHAHL